VANVAEQPARNLAAVRIRLTGHVQGVGFRPFVYRLANLLGITGSVQNLLGNVEVIAIAPDDVLQRFEAQLIESAPPLSRPTFDYCERIEVVAADDFQIISSAADADAQIFVPPDYFMCDDCRRELQDPANRRYDYPFINCTQCGPRYTLIEALPYDRPNTSMAGFPLCRECAAEYRDPADRRFHAEPVACAACGPRLTFEALGDDDIGDSTAALDAAVQEIASGQIVAVKGIGGYHLVCDALDAAAVASLRQRKHRPDKPLAVMFPVAGEDGLDVARRFVTLTAVEAELVAGPIRPIVLAAKRRDCKLAANVAPGLAEIGAFLPYSPLHQLILQRFDGPIVATSGNISGEPVLTLNKDASSRLANIADSFLQHDRPIIRPADDPVFRQIAGRPRPIRIGRGCAPLEMSLPWQQDEPLLAVGGHMKGTVALAWGNRVVVSPHIGEMDSPRSLDVFEQLVGDLQSLYGVRAERIVCDAHPGYTTRRWAQRQNDLPVDEVWHHAAHASAVAGEFDRPGPWLVFAWDGVGLGEDSSLWGGEALLGTAGRWQRVASLRTFRLPGGERAGREPWRSAAGVHWEAGIPWTPAADVDRLARAAWRQRVNTPVTSAAGRLFDAAAAVVLKVTGTSFEAQGPMLLESLCKRRRKPVELPITLDDDGVFRSDWEPLLPVLADETLRKAERAELFHSSVAAAILRQAHAVRDQYAFDQIGLCGGVFQNRILSEEVLALLSDAGFHVCMPQQLPCNDAALSFGQAAEMAARSGGA